MWIGRLIRRVKELRLDEKTIIVFSTDHGTHIGDEGCLHKTPGLLNSMVARLPLVVLHPDPQYAGKRINQLVSAVDFAPTFLDFLGIDFEGTYRRTGHYSRGLDIELEKMEMHPGHVGQQRPEQRVCDFIASLTDSHALEIYHQLFFPSPLVAAKCC